MPKDESSKTKGTHAPQRQGAPRKVRRPPQSTAAEQSPAPRASAPVRPKSPTPRASAPVRPNPPAKPSPRKQAAAQKAAAKKNAAEKRARKKATEQRVARQLAEKKAQQAKKAAEAQERGHAPLYNQDENIPPQPAKKKRKKRKKKKTLSPQSIRRRNHIRAVVAGLLVLVLVTVGIVYSLNLLFRVKQIEIQAPTGEVPADTGVYTEDVILARLGISLDDHFFSFSTAEQEAILQEALPLLENIQVLRDYPDTILVRVEPAVATYTMEIASGWVVLSAQLHVMETVTTQPDLLVLVGATPSTYVAGQSLAFVQTLEDTWYEEYQDSENLSALISSETQARSDAQIETLTTVLAALEDTALTDDITAIDFDGEDGVSFLYQDRITVLIGTTNSLDYKLQLVQYILQNENGDGCADTDTGLLDVSYQSADGTITTVFSAGEVVFPLDSAQSDVVIQDGADEQAMTEDALEESEAQSQDSADATA